MNTVKPTTQPLWHFWRWKRSWCVGALGLVVVCSLLLTHTFWAKPGERERRQERELRELREMWSQLQVGMSYADVKRIADQEDSFYGHDVDFRRVTTRDGRCLFWTDAYRISNAEIVHGEIDFLNYAGCDICLEVGPGGRVVKKRLERRHNLRWQNAPDELWQWFRIELQTRFR